MNPFFLEVVSKEKLSQLRSEGIRSQEWRRSEKPGRKYSWRTPALRAAAAGMLAAVLLRLL